MKTFIYKALLFFLPLYCFFFSMIVIDPFNYFEVFHFIPDDVKIKAIREDPETLVRNVALYKIIAFNKAPSPYVIIGDSRSQWLDKGIMDKNSNQPYFNFGVPGFNYREMAKAFWYCQSKIALEDVIWGCGFHNFTDKWGKGRSIFTEALDIYDNPLFFFTKKTLLQASFRTIKHYWLSKKKGHSAPPTKKFLSNKSFSAPQISSPAHLQGIAHFKKLFNSASNILTESISSCEPSTKWLNMQKKHKAFLDPKNLRSVGELEKIMRNIGRFADSNDISIHFAIFPDHIDYQNLILSNNRMHQKLAYISLLNNIGGLFYFDFSNEFTRDRCNYSDLFHPAHRGYSLITKELWADNPEYCFKIKKEGLSFLNQ